MDNLKNLKKQLGTIATVSLCLLVTSTAQAGAIVTEWSYETWAEFSSPTFQAGTEGTTFSGDYELSWGADPGATPNFFTDSNSGRSALTIGDGPTGDDRFGGGNISGSVDTIMGAGAPAGNELAFGVSATHWNNVLGGNHPLLTAGMLTNYLDLTAASPVVGSTASAPSVAFDFEFFETPNLGVNGFCIDGSSVPANGCPDLFGFAVDVNSPIGIGVPFMYDGNMYAIDILVFDENNVASPIGLLDEDYCAALGFVGTCAGLLTDERAHTTFQFGFDVRHVARQVPEPSSIALLAMALIFLGAKKYRVNIKK